jgi:hypothetical protein
MLMHGDGALDFLPLWGLMVATLFLVLLSIECGYRLGRYRHERSEEKEAPVGAMVGATLGLLAFLLAFTFGLAATRFDTRRQVLLDEVNAIGTAYLRAGLLPERREEVRALLREYVDVRLEAVRSGKVEQGMRQSEKLHGQLWEHAVALGEKNPGSIVIGLFVQSLNEVIDFHTKRVTVGLRHRIPGAIWAALYAVAVLALAAMGYHAGLTGTSRSLAVLAVAFTFSVVLWLVADLDRPSEGSLTVSQQGMIDLRNSMTEPKH